MQPTATVQDGAVLEECFFSWETAPLGPKSSMNSWTCRLPWVPPRSSSGFVPPVLGRCCNSRLFGGSCRGITWPSQCSPPFLGEINKVMLRMAHWEGCPRRGMYHPHFEPLWAPASLFPPWDTADPREGICHFQPLVFNTVTSGLDPWNSVVSWRMPTFWPMWDIFGGWWCTV